MRYDLLVPARTLFGWGRLDEVGSLAATLGRRAFIVSGSRTLETNGTLDRLTAALQAADIDAVRLGTVHREPRVSDVDRVVAELRAQRRDAATDGDFVLGVGGGAALDLAKASSALATNPGDSVRDFLEGVGTGASIAAPPLPLLAVPTTAGTGSECTKNAVISSDDVEPIPFKKSLRSDRMVPAAVLIDPAVTVSAQPSVTAQSGMDAITQLIESLISSRAQPIPRALALHGLELAVAAIEGAVRRPDDRACREAMAHAAFLSGIALANSGLGLAHGVAAALGIVAGVPHGLACAVMLPAALEVNRDVRRADIARVARLLGHSGSDDRAAAEAASPLACELNARLGIPSRLRELGVDRDEIPALVRGSRGNSMSGNPRSIDDDELTALLEGML